MIRRPATPALQRGRPLTAVLVILGAATLVGCAAIALGVPSWEPIHEYFVNGYASEEATLAVVSAAVWIAILGAVAVVASSAVREATAVRIQHRPWSRAVLFAGVGMIVLVAGIVRHLTTGYGMCCGDTAGRVQEALQLAK